MAVSEDQIMKSRAWNYGCDCWPEWPRWYRRTVYPARLAIHSPFRVGRFRDWQFPTWWRALAKKTKSVFGVDVYV